jgi:adenosylcobinamide-GDP ribazoletransferase
MKLDIKQERQLFFTALMFFTRIPCPKDIDHSADLLNRSARYFPVIGWVIGIASMATYSLTVSLLTPSIAVVITMAVGIILTGAFHEDGFADCCDGFGGGYTKERVLTIMKDSRVGAFGAIGMMMILLLKFVSLQAIAMNAGLHWMLASLLFAHAASRFGAFSLMIYLDYVQDIDVSKVKPIATKRPDPFDIQFAALAAILPLIFFLSWRAVIILPVAVLGPWLAGRYFKKRIGGYTGDCLGATQQVTEILIYIMVAGLCS